MTLIRERRHIVGNNIIATGVPTMTATIPKPSRQKIGDLIKAIGRRREFTDGEPIAAYVILIPGADIKEIKPA